MLFNIIPHFKVGTITHCINVNYYKKLKIYDMTTVNK